MQVLYGLMALAFNEDADGDVRARAYAAVSELQDWLSGRSSRDRAARVHYRFAEQEMRRLMDNPDAIKTLVPATVPPGSPIG